MSNPITELNKTLKERDQRDHAEWLAHRDAKRAGRYPYLVGAILGGFTVYHATRAYKDS